VGIGFDTGPRFPPGQKRGQIHHSQWWLGLRYLASLHEIRGIVDSYGYRSRLG
jgi:hypothetical protein